MTLVVIDTNALYKDPWLRSEPGRELLDRASRGECKVVLPKVVLDELRRHQHEWVQKHRDAITKVVEKMHGNPIDVSITATNVTRSFADLADQVDKSFDALEAHPGVEIAPIPTAPDITARLVERDLRRRNPFVEVGSESWSSGFRDAVIRETVLECLGSLEEDEILVFVSEDHGFLAENKRALHPHLLADLDAHGIARSRVVLAQNTFRAREEVHSLFAKVTERRELVAVSTDELFSLDGRSISMEMVYSGEYDYPDFVKFEAPFESSTIVAIDQITAFDFQPGGTDGVVAGVAGVTLTIDGYIDQAEWWTDDEPVYEVEEVVNDHVIRVSTSFDVRATVEIDTQGGPGQFRVTSIALEELPADKIVRSA